MEKNFLKNDEYRPNVAIVILNKKGGVLWCKRKNNDGWQFPQGGIDKNETPKQAILRETKEEVGLGSKDIKIICELSEWLKYDVPKDRRQTYFFKNNKFRGQVQKWFMAELTSHESMIDLGGDKVNEFSDWMWASYWYALGSVVSFKKKLYRQALTSLLPEYNQFISRKRL
tara:strand:+ start:615 stop:1127 length:513 start_codon:yes stop_codon:yes gene_type:complete